MDITRDGATLVLSGAFDVRSTLEVRTAIYDHLQGQDADVFVDLSEVTSIDVTALRVLAVATRRAAQTDRQLTLRGCCPAVRRLVHLSHLAHAVHVDRSPAPTARAASA